MKKKEESRPRIGAKTRLQKCWIWNRTVTDFVRYRVKGHSLNIRAGKNPLCDVNVDLDPQDPKISRADMRDLEFPDDTFDTVVSDPPWKIGFYQRMKPFFECVRVCKVGGTIIYNAYWIPISDFVELKEIWIRQDMEWSNASVISIFKKVKNTTTRSRPKGRDIPGDVL